MRSSNSAVCPLRATEGARRGRRAAAVDAASSCPDTPLDDYLAQARGARRHRRGAHRRRRDPQPERAVAGDPTRRGRAALHSRPAARRPQRAELPWLPLPGRLRLRPGDQRRRRASSAHGWRGRACSGGSQSTSSSCSDAAGAWTPYAIELNLRKGGTTHPFLTLQFLTDGRYDADTGAVPDARGAGRSTSSRPTTWSHSSSGAEHRRPLRHRGPARPALRPVAPGRVVFHMISCLTEHGRVGLTAVGDTPAEAEARYRRAERILLEEASAALAGTTPS